MNTTRITLLLLAATLPTFGQSYINWDWFNENKVMLGFAGLTGAFFGVLIRDMKKSQRINELENRVNKLEATYNPKSSSLPKNSVNDTEVKRNSIQTEEESEKFKALDEQTDLNTRAIIQCKNSIQEINESVTTLSKELNKLNQRTTTNWNYFSKHTLPGIIGLINPKDKKELLGTNPSAEDSMQAVLGSMYFFSKGKIASPKLERGIRDHANLIMINPTKIMESADSITNLPETEITVD